jgi:hypothetical protein
MNPWRHSDKFISVTFLGPIGNYKSKIGVNLEFNIPTGLPWLGHRFKGHKGPVKMPKCIGTGRGHMHSLFYSMLCPSQIIVRGVNQSNVSQRVHLWSWQLHSLLHFLPNYCFLDQRFYSSPNFNTSAFGVLLSLWKIMLFIVLRHMTFQIPKHVFLILHYM